MAEGSMADVMQKARDPHILLDERFRRALIAKNFVQRWVEMLGELTGKVHGAERMLKAAVLSRRVDPARALQLINIAEALHPRRVDQRFFGYFAFLRGNGKLNVTMNRIGDQRRAVIFIVDQLSHVSLLFGKPVLRARPEWGVILLKVRKSDVPSIDCRSFPCGFCEMPRRRFLV